MAKSANGKRRRAEAGRRLGSGTTGVDEIRTKYERLSWALDERQRRLWAANEALALGRGGSAAVSEATGMSVNRVRLGIQEMEKREPAGKTSDGRGRVRREGAGRPSVLERQPGLKEALEKLVDPVTRGDPQSPLRWTSKSLRHLARELEQQGYAVSPPVVGQLLSDLDYSLQGNRKSREGTAHPDRDAQFQYVAECVKEFQQQGQPVISVDTKKKEQVGNFKERRTEVAAEGRAV